MKYIKKFETQSEYNSFISNTKDFPNVCLITEDESIAYNTPPPLPFYIDTIESIDIKFSNTYEYSYDDITWKTGTWNTTLSPKAGIRVFFRASELNATYDNGIGSFTITGGTCNVGGSITSLVYGSDYVGKTAVTKTYQFKRLFKNATGIIDASELLLPSTEVSHECCNEMFSGCTGLVSAPELPATTLHGFCYQSMFNGCTSLVNIPKFLPAITVPGSNCYRHMFKGCTSLVYAPEIYATYLGTYSCYEMFSGCTNLTIAPTILLATTVTGSCYELMFRDCTSLVNAPELPATTLANSCYKEMFAGCTSLVNAPELPATTLANSCYKEMFAGCTSLVNAPELPATTLENSCYDSMFRDCTSLINAPVLPATTFNSNTAKYCYQCMFQGCVNLSYIKAMLTTSPTSSPDYGFTLNWVDGVSPTGTFVKNAAATWDVTGASGIPEGWTVETATA
jgi:hypothetical protein